MIILTQEQADYVRGSTENNAALMPILLVGGEFVLPEAVLEDENHKMHHEFLSSMPVREVMVTEWIKNDLE